MLPFSDACERNKGPILEVLRSALAHCVHVLEIGSGTGQHAVHFAAALPHLTWHPTEQLANLPDLSSRVSLEGTANIAPATQLDVRQSVWPLKSIDAVFTANTLHIMSWQAVEHLFAGIGRVLAVGGALCIYGPFRYQGRYTSPSNGAFDEMLKARDPDSGLRDIDAVTALAASYGVVLQQDHDLPAFNRCLVLHKMP